MGAVFARARFDIESPRIALLSIGEEAGKGSPLVKEAWGLLDEVDWASHGAEFVGNVEGRDLMGTEADVVVTDGFTGNVALKVCEGTAQLITTRLKQSFRKNAQISWATRALSVNLCSTPTC